MASSSIIVNNVPTRRPGVYTEPDYSGMAGGGALSRGVIAIVGSFENIKPNTAFKVGSAAALSRLLPESGPLLGNLIFDPSKDSRIPRGAQQAIVVGVNCLNNPKAQAVLALHDSQSGESLLATCNRWGSAGNRTTITKTAGTLANTHKIIVVQDGTTEVLDNMGGLQAFTAQYTQASPPGGSGGATSMVMVFDPLHDPRVTITYTKEGMVEGVYHPIKMVFDGPMSFHLSDFAPSGGTTITITGLAKDGSTSETVTIEPNGQSASATKHWTSVTSIDVENMPSESTWQMTGPAFSLNLADYPTVQNVVDRINSKADQGFVASVTTTLDARTLGLEQLDELSIISMTTVARGPNHDLLSIVTSVNSQSKLISMTRSATAVAPPSSLIATNMNGGTDGGVPQASDWGLALNVLKGQFCNWVWVNSDAAAIHAQLRAHLTYMWGKGKDERLAVVGVPTDTTKADTKTAIANLNCPFMSLVAQECQVYNPAGDVVWLAPKYLALLAMSMKAGTAIGEPLTWKYPNVLDYRQDSSWNPDDDAEEMLEGGLMFLARDLVGVRWERSITTYLQSSNAAQTELSSMESVGESCKDVRRFLEPICIGNRNTVVTASSIAGLTAQRLDRQADVFDLAIIKAWRRISVDDDGDAYVVSFEEAPVEPTNFVKITPHEVRIPKNA